MFYLMSVFYNNNKHYSYRHLKTVQFNKLNETIDTDTSKNVRANILRRLPLVRNIAKVAAEPARHSREYLSAD